MSCISDNVCARFDKEQVCMRYVWFCCISCPTFPLLFNVTRDCYLFLKGPMNVFTPYSRRNDYLPWKFFLSHSKSNFPLILFPLVKVTHKNKKLHSVNWNAPLYAAPAPGHHKIEVTPAVAVGDPGKGGRANETVTPTLTAQVGGACSIVHVLEWKEGMAILPSSNLKVNRYFFF